MYPVVNIRPGLQGSLPRPAVRVMGQAQSQALQAAASAAAAAQAVSERIRANYNALLETVGKDSADQAVQQSTDSLSRAQAQYNSLLQT